MQGAIKHHSTTPTSTLSHDCFAYFPQTDIIGDAPGVVSVSVAHVTLIDHVPTGQNFHGVRVLPGGNEGTGQGSGTCPARAAARRRWRRPGSFACSAEALR